MARLTVLTLMLLGALLAAGSVLVSAQSPPMYRATVAGVAADGWATVALPSAGPTRVLLTPTPSVIYRPDPVLTPGDVFSDATKEAICVSGYSRTVRDVPPVLARRVAALYGMADVPRAAYKIDHLIPLALGGSNDVRNLWPHRYDGGGGWQRKDYLEERLHDAVCEGRVDLETARRAIATDWWAAYLQYAAR